MPPNIKRGLATTTPTKTPTKNVRTREAIGVLLFFVLLIESLLLLFGLVVFGFVVFGLLLLLGAMFGPLFGLLFRASIMVND